LTFNQSVKLSGLVIKSSAGGQAPKIVKLFVNQPTIGFSGKIMVFFRPLIDFA
jgi:hypothetical protein